MQALLRELAVSAEHVAHTLRQHADMADVRPQPDEWSPREHAAHLLVIEIAAFFVRIQRMVNEETPTFRYFWNTGWDFDSLTLNETVEEWLRWRGRTIKLASSLSADQLARVGQHPTFGALNTEQLLTIARDHDLEHLKAIETIINANP